MSERVKIDAQTRTVTGKKVKQLRRQGLVPGVIYGQKDPLNVQMNAIDLRRALRIVGTTQLADVAVDDGVHTVLVRDIQQHVTRGDVMHVDFLEVNMAETITTEAELVSIGDIPDDLKSMGSAVLAARSVEIECKPDALISEIEVDFTMIETPDDLVFVSDLVTPEGVEILTESDMVVARFEYLELEPEEEEEEEELFMPAADAVEVIGREKDEDELLDEELGEE